MQPMATKQTSIQSLQSLNIDINELNHLDINDPLMDEPIKMPKCTLHPHSRKRVIWDVIVMFLLLYTCIEVPFTLAFNIKLDLSSNIGRFGLTVDIFLLIDVVLNFKTALFDRYDSLYLILDKKEIACHYIKGWFFIDLFTSIPFDYMFSNFSGSIHAFQLLRVFRILRVLKLLRVFRLLKTMHHVLNSIMTKNLLNFMRIMKLLFIMLICSHYISCLWFFVGMKGHIDGKSNWLDTRKLLGSNVAKQYMASFYWSTVTLFTTGLFNIKTQYIFINIFQKH